MKDEDDKEQSNIVTLILIRLPSICTNGFGTQYQLIAPEGFGQQVLRRLVYSGCKAIGIRELASIHFEAGIRQFPYHYPETEAGQNWLKNYESQNVIQKYALRPPSKRVNF